MADRKVYATVEGTLLVPLRVKREVCIRIDEGADIPAALEAAGNGERGDHEWNIVYAEGLEFQGDIDDVTMGVHDAADDDVNFKIDNVIITDSK